jgi:hypothetical protein
MNTVFYTVLRGLERQSDFVDFTPKMYDHIDYTVNMGSIGF